MAEETGSRRWKAPRVRSKQALFASGCGRRPWRRVALLGARLAWRSDPPIRVPSEPGGTYYPYGRKPSFFPEAGSIGERQEVSGLRRVGVNPPRHADAEVGRFEIAPAIDKPLSRQDPVGDVVRDAVTRRAVACHGETGSGELEVVLVGPYN